MSALASTKLADSDISCKLVRQLLFTKCHH